MIDSNFLLQSNGDSSDDANLDISASDPAFAQTTTTMDDGGMQFGATANAVDTATSATDRLTVGFSAVVQGDNVVGDGAFDTNGPSATLAAGNPSSTLVALTNESFSLASSAADGSSIAHAGPVLAALTTASAVSVEQPFVGVNPPPTITISDGGTVDVDGVSAQSVTFAGSSGTLVLGDAAGFTGQVSGLSGSDGIDFADFIYGANTQVTYAGNAEGGTLTISDGTQTANVNLVGDYLSSAWDLSNEGGGTLVVDPTWTTLKVGAGGWVTGLDIAPNGVMVARTDTYGAYIWNGTQWQQLVTTASMPAAFTTQSAIVPMAGQQGVDEIQVAPSNSSILYMMYDGYVFQSSNDGTTWTETSFAPVASGSNDAYRMDGQRMAIDPNNPNVVYVGTIQNGLFVTTNGGATWQNVSAVPVSTEVSGVYPGITGILFDPAVGGTTGGKTNTIFASSYGNGVYESTNAGASWTHLSGGPSNVEYAALSSAGAYYAVGDGGTDLWAYANGAWTELLTPSVVGGNTLQGVAVDPLNQSEIVAITDGGSLDISYNGGATWSSDNWAESESSSDIPWLTLAKTENQYMAVGGVQFSPTVPNELIVSDGIGVWTTTIPTSGFAWNTPVTWNDQSSGIEQLVAWQIVVPPGGDPVLASMDRAFFYITNATAYPSTYGPVDGNSTATGFSLDYASSDPSFMVGIAEWSVEQSGYSTNGGQTWTPFATDIPGADTSFMGGTIAASTPTDIIWAPAEGNQPYYTLNGGETWNAISLPGVTSWSNFDHAWYLDTRTVTADRVLANTFYLYYPNYGVFETTNGGVNWTEVHSGSISPTAADDSWNAEIQSVPGEAGNLFFTAGALSGSYPDGVGFYRSTNQGATWTAVANVQDVYCFGYGAAAPGQSYPAIYIVGYVSGVFGVWQSINNAQTWTQIGTNPNNSIDSIQTISGDPNVYGQVYVGFSGSGYAILTAPPSVTSVAASPSTGVESAGQTITITINLTALVTVTGTPTLSLNDGGTATYAGGSGTNALTFSYTISAGQSTSALAITAANLPNGATITDDIDTSAVLSGALTTFSGLQITSSGTGVTSIIESPSSGDLNTGKTVTLTLTMSGNVTVNISGGTPTLTLNDGSTATYTGGSGTNALTFGYTVGAGQNTTALAATAVNLNGGTITDGSGNAAILSISGLTQTGPQIGTITPTITAIAESPLSGDLDAGKTVSYTLTMSEVVNVNTAGGSPTLSLNDGGAASFTGGSGSNALTFLYTVQAGQNTPDLMISAVNLNGATIADSAGNAASLSLTGLAQGSPQIDTTPPVISSVTAPAGDYQAGQTLTLTLNMTEPVNVTGTPTLSLNDGGTASYVSGAGTNTLAFSYVLGTGQNAGALSITGVTGTITDVAGNALSTTLPPPISGVIIGAASISSVTETPSSGDLGAGKTVTLTLAMSEVVTANTTGGTPTLTLNDGGTATYSGGSGTNALTFSYTAASGQNTAGLTATAVNLNGGTIVDGGGNAASLSLTGLPQLGPQIDTTTPIMYSLAVSGPGITNGQGDVGVGKSITFTINMSEAVTVANGTPSMTLNNGGSATYASGSGTNALVFTYTVAVGQNVANLEVSSFNYNGAAITDGAGNAANVNSVKGNPANGLQIDTTTPAISSIAETPSSGDLNAGKTVTFTLTLSETVTVTGGTPTLTLNDGGTATYTSGSGSKALSFSYTVGAGQNTAALAATAVNLNSATITDGAGNAANLSLTGLTQIGPQIATSGNVVSGSNSPWIVSNTQTDTGDSITSGGTEIVSSGGTTIGATVSAAGVLEVLSGGTVSGVTVLSGGTLEFVSGAIDPTLTILSGGTLEIGAGYTETGYVVANGVTLEVASGGTVSGTTVSSGGTEAIASGGVDGGTTLVGGTELVSAGGIATGTIVSSGAVETVFGSAVNAAALSGGTLNVSSGGVATGTTVSSGGTLDVLSGASVSSTTIISGGTLNVSSGGVATNTTVSSGGHHVVLHGGHTSGTQVYAGGVEIVSSGGVDSGTTLVGGIEYVMSGGVDPGTVVSSGGMDVVYGSTTDVTVLSGGQLIVSSGGATSGTLVSSGGTDIVSSGGIGNGTTVSNGGTEIVSVGGATNSTTVDFGGMQFDIGTAGSTTLSGGAQTVFGIASGTVISAGGAQGIVAGGTATNTTINSSGIQYDDGTANSTTVDSGGMQFDIGTADSTTLSGGAQTVFGTASGTVISAGGAQGIVAGGTANNTTINSGGIQYDYGTANGTTVNNGGTQFDLGTADGTTLSGGNQTVFGIASGTVISTGGSQGVVAGGTASNTTINSGAMQDDFGTATGTTLSGGAQTVFGIASGTVISTGGAQGIVAGGTATNTTINSGGIQFDYGTVNSTTVNSGGMQDVFGTASSTTLSGGDQTLFGVASGTVISTGGAQGVTAGGTANDTTINSGGIQYDYGTADNTTINSGGYQVIEAAGTISGATISGGTLELQNGANEADTFNFASGGMLTLDGTGTYNMLVAGFTSATAEMDLTSINYAGATASFAEASNNTSGTLTVANGASSASVLLLGNYVAGAASFTLEKDGGGGTIVFDPPVVAGTNPNGLATPHH